MAIQRFFVEYTKVVRIDLDEDKFTPEFMEEFRGWISDYHTLDEHAQHLGYICARDEWSPADRNLEIEGYGRLADMGIRFGDAGYPRVQLIEDPEA